jgi:hypothetical protein
MGWRGTYRAYRSAVNSIERSARRRQKELDLQQKQANKMQEIERAQYEVSVYENKIDLLLTLHKDCSEVWNWKQINSSEPPEIPIRSNHNEKKARYELKSYKPGFMDKLLDKVDQKVDGLKDAVRDAIKIDENKFKKDMHDYEEQLNEWKSMVDLSSRIMNCDPKAYIEAIQQINPFYEIKEIGAKLSVKNITRNFIEIDFYPDDETVIPSETKSLLKSGKLSIKETPISKLNQMYQDYICSALLRIARELFALLPVEMVFITAIKNILNSQTGYMEEKPVLSAAIPRKTMDTINFDLIDPSDSMGNFIHHMKFNKLNGFMAVERIVPEKMLSDVS